MQFIVMRNVYGTLLQINTGIKSTLQRYSVFTHDITVFKHCKHAKSLVKTEYSS